MLAATLLFALGCTPSAATVYRDALAAPSVASGVERCGGLEEGDQDCLLAVMDRFEDYEGCDRLVSRHDCHFRRAESLGRHGSPVAGIRACREAGAWRPLCDDHLLAMLAARGESVAEAEALFASVAIEGVLATSRPRFLRRWFRRRLEQGVAFDEQACSDRVCSDAAAHEREMFRGRGPAGAVP